ncbi:MAG: nucleotidyltransferase family protein [Edaphobacter sp.]
MAADLTSYEAIILAGGKGTRLSTVVPNLPKPLAPIAGQPFLNYLLRQLGHQGIRKVYLSVGHLWERVRETYGNRFENIDLVYVVESSPLGTGGAVRGALGQTNGSNIFVLNGDTFADISLSNMDELHARNGRKLTMALSHVPNASRYGGVQVENGIVTGFLEKGISGPGYINAGCYLLDRSIFDRAILPSAFSLESDFLIPNLSSLRPMAFFSDGYFIDIGVPEDYARAEIELSSVQQR